MKKNFVQHITVHYELRLSLFFVVFFFKNEREVFGIFCIIFFLVLPVISEKVVGHEVFDFENFYVYVNLI